MKKLTTLLTVILFISSNIFAQLGEIKGFVKNKKTGEPIWNASVYVEFAGNMIGDAADFDGKYTIKALNPGTYTVITKIQGYAPVKTRNVLVTSDNIAYVNVDMITTAEELPEFVFVTHTIPLLKKDEPGVQHIIPKQFKQSVHRNNPIKAIESMASGVTVAPNGKDVYIRGSRPSSTQFITDGMKSITGSIGIPGQAIGSIKVYTGGVPASYGDVSGGVIVVETKSYFDLAQKFK
ncbi:MAG: hypothetical protein COB15_00270 [Flavobacteriales bacterium]|nr:MAG: hypothetical protein COB15_00270 [Flavobacteriales bacterium]